MGDTPNSQGAVWHLVDPTPPPQALVPPPDPHDNAHDLFGVWQRVAAKLAYMLVKRTDPAITEAEAQHQGAVLLLHVLDIERSTHPTDPPPAAL